MTGSTLPIDPRSAPGELAATGRADVGAPFDATSDDVPRVGLDHLDTLWFQVTGTIAGAEFALDLWLLESPATPSFTYQGTLIEGRLQGTFYFSGDQSSARLTMTRS